jgi:hypothetical protein
MPKNHGAGSELAPLLDGSAAWEMITVIVGHGLKQLIELEAAGSGLSSPHGSHHESCYSVKAPLPRLSFGVSNKQLPYITYECIACFFILDISSGSFPY